MSDQPDGVEASGASRGSSELASDGGEPVEDGGELVDPAAVGHEEEHEDHASIWPFVTAVGSFFTLLGASGISEGSFPPGMAGAFYFTTLVGGGIVLMYALVEMAREDFTALEGPFGESWPFTGVSNTKLGVWIFLASDVVLFGAFIGSYVFIRVAEGWTNWHHLIPEAHVTLPGLINTYLLLTSSFAVVLALVAAERGSAWGVVTSLLATLVLGVGFLVNKALEWLHLFHIHTGAFPEGWELSTNIASSTFYLTTGLHGAHVTAGLIIAVYMLPRAWRGAYSENDEPLELFGLYWHFVDIVWLFLFPLFYIL